jgi:hypothetical protein
MRSAYKISVVRPENKRDLGRPRCRCMHYYRAWDFLCGTAFANGSIVYPLVDTWVKMEYPWNNIDSGNRRKPYLSAHKFHMPCPGNKLQPPREKLATNSSVSIVSGYGLDDRSIEVRSPAEAKEFFLWPLCPDRLWGPLSLMYSGYRGSFPRG